MSRHFSSERFLAGCLLVTLMVGIFALKFWVVSVEERLAENLTLHRMSVGTDNSQTNVLNIHEGRLRTVERTAWVVWDHHAPCDGWPTQQQIAQGTEGGSDD